MRTITTVETNDVDYFCDLCGIEIDESQYCKLRRMCKRMIEYIRSRMVLNND